MSKIYDLIEGWAKGMKSSVREDPDKPVEGFQDWSLAPTTDEPATAPSVDAGPAPAAALPGTPLDAARAVREAGDPRLEGVGAALVGITGQAQANRYQTAKRSRYAPHPQYHPHFRCGIVCANHVDYLFDSCPFHKQA